MSQKNLVKNALVIEYDGRQVLDSAQLGPVETIRDVKRAIERCLSFSVGMQLLSYENTLLQETLTLEDLRFKQGTFNSMQNMSRQTHQAKASVIRLTLNIKRGQVNLKVNVIAAQREPIQIELLVYGSTSIYQLRQLISARLPKRQRDLNSAEIVLSYNQQMLDGSKYLFEALYDAICADEDGDQDGGNGRHN